MKLREFLRTISPDEVVIVSTVIEGERFRSTSLQALREVKYKEYRDRRIAFIVRFNAPASGYNIYLKGE